MSLVMASFGLSAFFCESSARIVLGLHLVG